MSGKVEVWKPILLEGVKPSVPYMISNLGRFGVMAANGKVEVRSFKPSGGYYRYNIRHRGRNKAIFLFKEVARAFLRKPSSVHKFVIHKDHNYLNDKVENLSWATAAQHRLHAAQSPNSKKARARRVIAKSSHSKLLDEKSVRALKTMIWDPKRKLPLKQIAERFGVSEMQIYRIKNGEFWFHVHVPHEPLHKKYLQNLKNLEMAGNPSKPEPSPGEKQVEKGQGLKSKKGRKEKPEDKRTEEKAHKKPKHKKDKKHKHKKHKKKHRKKDKKKKHKKHKHK